MLQALTPALRKPESPAIVNSVVIRRSAQDLYRSLRRLRHAGEWMSHIRSAIELDAKRSRWVAEPITGVAFQWDAEMVYDVPSQHLCWRSLESSRLPNEVSVFFWPLPAGRGTLLTVELRHMALPGKLGAMLARLFPMILERRMHDDLQRYKQRIEAAEVVLTP